MTVDRLSIENYAGRLVPRVLGLVLAGTAAIGTIVLAAGRAAGPVRAAGWGALAATSIVFVAGLIDDLVPGGPRGLRNHVRVLAGGRVTTGILKVFVVAAAAIVAIALQDKGSGGARIAGVVLVAACANVWNGLDVRPGRALKAFLIVQVGLWGVDLASLPTLPGVVAGAVLALGPDLRERAMLGDGGANLLGFTVGLGLFLVLPTSGIVGGAIVAVALNILADTVTFSRVIGATRALAWVDRLGRRPE